MSGFALDIKTMMATSQWHQEGQDGSLVRALLKMSNPHNIHKAILTSSLLHP